MKNSILIKVGLFLFAIFLIAPFTFLKPAGIVQAIDPLPIEKVEKIKTNVTAATNPKKTVKRKLEKPLHNVNLPDFSAIENINAKKKLFFNFIKPVIVNQNKKLLTIRAKLNSWMEKVTLELPLNKQERSELTQLVKKYEVNRNASLLTKLNALLLRVDIIPLPLVLVQAANESAWGTSRFSRVGLNFFGIWCYEEGCGMVPGGRIIGEKHEVEAFSSLEEAVTRYFDNINTNNAYSVFRTIRAELRLQEQKLNPAVLATGLLPYSERGVDYVNEITNMLRHNQKYF
ncbi:glucosaminidase domain-containing protein [Colwellia sp. MSW7]|jgi:Bax protein|uniref:Glucosaminidase domain-containing protein n=1 Tax=Colwellia maritima TaxID=2912588 RepID=A0ABS9X415_9GAMM|nr:glucosaminidase domain-containing protein [Colwellia maritima]MCI2284532.1 glucosaminidase domain-containing protein [Colwellia maritima]